MEFQQESEIDDDNLQNILQDIAITEDNTIQSYSKKDNTIFIIDCSPQIMKPLPNNSLSEFQKVMQSYKNFMMSKVIANCNDRVGLIFYNVNKKQNSLNFQNMCTVHQLEVPSARMIKSVDKIVKDFVISYGHSHQQVPLHQVLWLFGQEIKDCDAFNNHARLFLFTTEDCPHTEADQKRDQAINYARQLAAKGAHIQLFPIRRQLHSKFDLRKFYQQIVAFDPQDLTKNALDNSSKIMDLQTRIRQKQFKKRTLNRLLMQIGEDTFIGVQIYTLFSKAKKPLRKKVESSTNKPLQRVIKKFNVNGEVLYNEQIGSYYPLGGEKVILTKDDMNKIKGLRKPGLTLIGFKPRRLIKPYHNLRPSYFLYPDESHVTGSTQFFDALIDELTQIDNVAIVSILPRMNQEFRFAALFPQKQSYDQEDHHQTPPGFHMIFLPYSDDIVNFTGGQKLNVKPTKVSAQLIQLTKLLINNLTVPHFDFRDFENPSLQKFYSHLQAHALNQSKVQEKQDTIQPDLQGFQKFTDIFNMIDETADAQIQEQMPEEVRRPKRQSVKKQEKKQEQNLYDKQPQKKQKRTSSKPKQPKKDPQQKLQPQKKPKSKPDPIQSKHQQNEALTKKVQEYMEDGIASRLTKEQITQYLKLKKLNCSGDIGQLVDRIMIYISFSL